MCVCVCVRPHLGVVIVCVWKGGERCGRGEFYRYHLSAYGHSSLRSLHHGLQFVGRNVFGVDQQHHLGVAQETGPKLREADCLFIDIVRRISAVNPCRRPETDRQRKMDILDKILSCWLKAGVRKCQDQLIGGYLGMSVSSIASCSNWMSLRK